MRECGLKKEEPQEMWEHNKRSNNMHVIRVPKGENNEGWDKKKHSKK